MACGETEPNVHNEDWTWAPRLRNGRPVGPRRRAIKNKNITLAIRGGRRISIVTASGKIELSDWVKQKEKQNKAPVTEIV